MENSDNNDKQQNKKGLYIGLGILLLIILLCILGVGGYSLIKKNSLFNNTTNTIEQRNNSGNNDTIIEIDGETVNLSKLDSNSVTKYYGKIITTYADYMDFALYYVDYEGKFGEKGTVYLKATEGKSIHLNNIGKISGKDDALKIMKQLNPNWNNNRGTLNYDELETNEDIALYFNNPKVCTQIEDELKNKYGKEYINYVIAAPSVELFAKSFNACGKLDDTNAVNVKWMDKSSTIEEKDGYKYVMGYNFYNSNEEDLNSQNNEKIFKLSDQQTKILTQEQRKMLYNNCGMQWFSSPMSSTFSYSICSINEYGELNGVTMYAVACPLVSIKPGAHLFK